MSSFVLVIRKSKQVKERSPNSTTLVFVFLVFIFSLKIREKKRMTVEEIV